MGNENSSIAKDTGMLESDVQRLQEKFDILRTGDNPGSPSHDLTESQFVSKFPPQQEELAKMIFTAMDVDDSKMIDFREFCTAVAVLSQGTDNDKINFVFTLYDKDRKGYISYPDMKRMVAVFKRTSESLLESMQVKTQVKKQPRPVATGGAGGGSGKGSKDVSSSDDEGLGSRQNSVAGQINTPRDSFTNSGSGSGTVMTSTAAATQIFESMKPGHQGHVSKADFERWCLENGPQVKQQMDIVFNALKRAAYWDWDSPNSIDREKKAREDEMCAVM